MGTFNFSPRFSKADCFLIRLNTTQHSNYNKRDTKTKLSWVQQFLSNFGYPFSSNMKIYLKMMLLTIRVFAKKKTRFFSLFWNRKNWSKKKVFAIRWNLRKFYFLNENLPYSQLRLKFKWRRVFTAIRSES